MKIETKLQKKKDKIRGLIFDFQEKETEVERMKEELESLRSKVKQLNKKVREERKSKVELENKQHRSKSQFNMQSVG